MSFSDEDIDRQEAGKPSTWDELCESFKARRTEAFYVNPFDGMTWAMIGSEDIREYPGSVWRPILMPASSAPIYSKATA